VQQTFRYRSGAEGAPELVRRGVEPRPDQPRPAFGFVPWLALEVRAFCFFFDVRFDIGARWYRRPPPTAQARPYAAACAVVQARTSSAAQVFTIDSIGTPQRTALSQP
jgi:hypothetical protein